MFISKFPRSPERLKLKAEKWESDLLEAEIRYRHDPDRLLCEPFTKDQLIEYFAFDLKSEKPPKPMAHTAGDYLPTAAGSATRSE